MNSTDRNASQRIYLWRGVPMREYLFMVWRVKSVHFKFILIETVRREQVNGDLARTPFVRREVRGAHLRIFLGTQSREQNHHHREREQETS